MALHFFIYLYSTKHFCLENMVVYHFQVISLNTQLSYFKNVEKQFRRMLGDEAAKKVLFEAVYLISIGTNDYLSPFFRYSTVFQSYSQKQYINMVVGNLTEVIKVI